MLTSSCSIFPSKELERTLEFYTRLGFELQGRWDDHGYLIFQKDAVEIHFANDPGHVAEKANVAAYFRTDDVDSWSDELAKLDIWQEEGFPRFRAAEDKSWGMREMHILDPDGHLLRVGQFPDG